MTARRDGRGHWPAGKRRGAGGASRTRSIEQLRRRIAQRGWSRRAVAADLGVADRTVRRWIADEDYPTADNLHALRQWPSRQ